MDLKKQTDLMTLNCTCGNKEKLTAEMKCFHIVLDEHIKDANVSRIQIKCLQCDNRVPLVAWGE